MPISTGELQHSETGTSRLETGCIVVLLLCICAQTEHYNASGVASRKTSVPLDDSTFANKPD